MTDGDSHNGTGAYPNRGASPATQPRADGNRNAGANGRAGTGACSHPCASGDCHTHSPAYTYSHVNTEGHHPSHPCAHAACGDLARAQRHARGPVLSLRLGRLPLTAVGRTQNRR